MRSRMDELERERSRILENLRKEVERSPEMTPLIKDLEYRVRRVDEMMQQTWQEEQRARDWEIKSRVVGEWRGELGTLPKMRRENMSDSIDAMRYADWKVRRPEETFEPTEAEIFQEELKKL